MFFVLFLNDLIVFDSLFLLAVRPADAPEAPVELIHFRFGISSYFYFRLGF